MALGCMEHRGGCSADNDSGDGAGLLTNVPWELFKRDLPDLKEAHTGCDGCLDACRRSAGIPRHHCAVLAGTRAWCTAVLPVADPNCGAMMSAIFL